MAATSISPRNRIPRRRQTRNPQVIRWARDDLPKIKPIVLPEKKTSPRVSRLIKWSSSVAVVGSFFTSLPYDIRRAIYETILREAGFRQHIFCSTSKDQKGTFGWKTLGNRLLVHQKCDDDKFEKSLICGHGDCESTENDFAFSLEGEEFRIVDLISLMRVCKFGYDASSDHLKEVASLTSSRYLEISEYLYRSVTFIFGSYPELQNFADVIHPTNLARVRSVAIIAHLLPKDPQACQQFIKGQYFQTENEGKLTLLRRIPNLKKLEINFYPSLILAFSTQVSEVLKPLNQLENVPNIVVTLPGIAFDTSYTDVPSLLLPRMPTPDGEVTFRRPVVVASQADCKAYSHPW